MEVSKVGVLGGGLMGHGIAQLVAEAGHEVVLRERNEEKLEKAYGRIDKQLARAVEKGSAEQGDAEAARRRIHGTLDYGDLADCDLVIEAITEDLELKLEMWREVDSVVKDGAVFATNTSSLGVIDQAAVTRRPERFIGLHFFNPPQLMPLLEVVQTVTTDEESLRTGFDFGSELGKTCVHAKDKTGFIVNRLLVPYLLDAIRAYEDGTGSIDQIDAGMKAGANHPMGPFALLDFVGLDTVKAIADIMFDEYRERRFAAPPTLRKMVTAGFYGRKSGRGFYDYTGEKPVPVELGL
jgi:3-hydroxybutyryl-CoA dehydrogenase